MGRYIVCKSPVVKMDLMVRKEYQPQLVGYFQQTGCTYEREETSNPGNNGEWVCLKNVESTKGWSLGDLLGMFYKLEWSNRLEDRVDKFYIIINAKKKGKKKHVCENREKVDAGSESGNSGEPEQPSESGSTDGPGGNIPDIRYACLDDPGEQPGLPDTCDGRCE